MRLDRTSNSIVARWWWTIDRPTLLALFMLICVGAVMVTASSPAVAVRIGVNEFHFIHRQYAFLLISLLVMFAVSLQPPQNVRRLAIIGFMISIALMVVLPFVGMEIKGAKRWVTIIGISIQPSEFLKPCMAVVTAWIFHLRESHQDFPGWRIAIGLYALVIALLLIQPDLGMVVTISVMWAIQFFLAGMPLFWVLVMPFCGAGGLFVAYHVFAHVKKRIDNFLDPSFSNNYQVAKSLEAFASGGWFGRGPGEGKIKLQLPDSHTDFVFAVACEEFGIIACLIILGLFAFIVIRGLINMWKENDFFTVIAVAGLLAQFGIQSIINMGVAVDMLPAKGMTLPFLSYGGSSLVAIALGMGMMLAFTRKKYGHIAARR
ncbi:MAG TPA: putative lipid II flippase FtsW [Rickettsiales bacterium]|nr:putative lipid II flippase FtsW [Rickettsiales bacterium]